MRKLKPALVHGKPATFWRVRSGQLVHRHPRGDDYAEVPIQHLSCDPMLAEHVNRLRGKSWVREPAIAELLEIAAGALR